VIEPLGIAATDGVFVDDQLRNVRGAERAGLQAVAFDVTAPAVSYREALKRLGVAVPPALQAPEGDPR
jgi:putative hydrolase of the HAD superfamily